MSYTPPIGSASTTAKGIIKLAQDLGGTADLPTVPGLATKASSSTTVTGANSVTGGGDLSANRTLSLVGDAAAPGNSMYYGTNGAGTKGFYSVPSAPVAATAAVLGTVKLAGDLAGTDGNAPTVAKVNGVAVTGTPTSGQVITATSGTAASWQTPATGFADPLTTKGDLIVRGAATTRQPIGTDGQVLIANSAQTTGMNWGAVNDTTAVKLAGSTMTGKLIVPTFQVTGGSPAAGEVLTSDASGNATWQPATSPALNIYTQTTTITAAKGDYILANANAAAFTITLPTAATAGSSAIISVKKIDAQSANIVTVNVSGGGLIDGSTTDTISAQWESRDFMSNGTQWYKI